MESRRTCDLTVIVLTYNEEVNLPHLISNISDFCDHLVVVDSYSTDRTVDIAAGANAEIFYRQFDDYSQQRNYSLNCKKFETKWLMVLDADEYLTEELKDEIRSTLENTNHDAFMIKRRFYWRGKWIRFGYYPTWLLRLGKVGSLACDDRKINEHLISKTGNVGHLDNDFCDENHSGLSAWISKHNGYSDREAQELISFEKSDQKHTNPNRKEKARFLKRKVWKILPPLLRPILLFLYRYVFKLGFLGGLPALEYFFLHSFLYRLLIDLKYLQLRKEKK